MIQQRHLRIGLAALLLWAAPPLAAQVPTPTEHFGFAPGTNRHLANWQELSAYYDRVAATSDRVTIDTLGATTRGQPFVMLTITSPQNQADLPAIRQNHLRLADPRTIRGPEELARVKRDAKAIVLLTAHVHSTEVGAGQMPANLLYHLATSTDEDMLQILDRVVLLVIPSLNPDGTEMVSNWYRQYLDTAFEGAPPVELYHPYIGHDNNRDWYALTQKETVLTVTGAHNPWRPMIVHDVHQMGPSGARMFVPPYVEPFERNVDPLIVSAINQMGSYMAAEMTTRGFDGVVTSAQYDLFTPARAFQHYHGGARILSETASAQLATPLDLTPIDLHGTRGFEANRPSMNFPSPWTGGEWGLEQIVAYQEAGAMALLRNAARNRDFWVDTFYEVNRRATEKWASWPDYWLIPPTADRIALDAMLRILTLGTVEIQRAESPFAVGDDRFPQGTYVISMRQPSASWAQTLLEIQQYPELRDYPGGPPTRPYDVTAHTLPLLMGVDADPVWGEMDVELGDAIPTVEVEYTTPEPFQGVDAPRIGIYRGWRESIAAGWTRWVFDQHAIRYDSLTDEDIRSGRLNDRFDVILFQEQDAGGIMEGWRSGEVPEPYVGGIGPQGLIALREFVYGGGRIVAVETAADLMVELFDLPVANTTARLPITEFYIPGSILGLELNQDHPLAGGMNARSIAWFWRTSRGYQLTGNAGRVVARYGPQSPRLSGWALGDEALAGDAAIVDFQMGEGSIVLFGFQPNYRGHSIATWPLLFNSLSVGLER